MSENLQPVRQIKAFGNADGSSTPDECTEMANRYAGQTHLKIVDWKQHAVIEPSPAHQGGPPKIYTWLIVLFEYHDS